MLGKCRSRAYNFKKLSSIKCTFFYWIYVVKSQPETNRHTGSGGVTALQCCSDLVLKPHRVDLHVRDIISLFLHFIKISFNFISMPVISLILNWTAKDTH